ncbi:MAG TPA: glycosyltransferase family 2 protein, partial [Patescibacteria group bacterium]|nr:glycosyltransferase family 2 protein [Patescibacteria group bacterium]
MDSRRDQGGPDLIDDTPALSVVIPVYNEGENVVPTLRGMVERTKTRPLEVLVVHDFDDDTTVPVVKRLQAEIPELRLHKNSLGRGVLNAMKSGLRAARAPYVLVTMGDGSDDPSDVDAMYALAREGKRAAYPLEFSTKPLSAKNDNHGDFPWQVVHIDHTQVDVELVDEATGLVLG